VPKYRVCYRRGSFALADDCENYGEALARARYLKSQRGVWTVRLEDMAGALVCGDFDLGMQRPEFGFDGPFSHAASRDAEILAEFAANSFQ
jgi:hypothetical protein